MNNIFKEMEKEMETFFDQTDEIIAKLKKNKL